MPFKHPADRQAWQRIYYQAHKEKLLKYAKEYYEWRKNDPAFKATRAEYMRLYRKRVRSMSS